MDYRIMKAWYRLTRPIAVSQARRALEEAGKGFDLGHGFEPGEHTLDVVKGGNGSGTVSSSPIGIDCGADCSQPYNYGQIITLTAREPAQHVANERRGIRSHREIELGHRPYPA